MKNLLLSLLIILFGLFTTSCADKKAFKLSATKPSAAIVYIYVEDDTNIDDSFVVAKYDVLINGNKTAKSLKVGEFIKLDVKAVPLAISIARQDLEIQTVKLEPKVGEIYYLRAQSNSIRFGAFDFELVSSSQGSEEIANNVSSSEYVVDEKMLDMLVKSDKQDTSSMSEDQIDKIIEEKLKAMNASTSQQASSSTVAPAVSKTFSRTGNKLADIRNAYEMKKQGLLTEEEFLQMKSEILAK